MNSNTGSLFGGSNLGKTTTPQSNSLFGSVNAANAPGNSSAGTIQGMQSSSLFGPQPQAQQQPGQSSFLGQGQPQPNNGQTQGRVSSQATQPAFFNSLLERGKKRPLSGTAQNGNFEDVPSLQLGLDDIRRKARELGASGSKEAQKTGLTTKA